jgi:hypothetical protein
MVPPLKKIVGCTPDSYERNPMIKILDWNAPLAYICFYWDAPPEV